MIVVGPTFHHRFCVPIVITLMPRYFMFIINGKDNGLYLFPFTREPHTLVECRLLGCFPLRLTGCSWHCGYLSQRIFASVGTLMECPEYAVFLQYLLIGILCMSHRDKQERAQQEKRCFKKFHTIILIVLFACLQMYEKKS